MKSPVRYLIWVGIAFAMNAVLFLADSPVPESRIMAELIDSEDVTIRVKSRGSFGYEKPKTRAKFRLADGDIVSLVLSVQALKQGESMPLCKLRHPITRRVRYEILVHGQECGS